MSPNKSSTFGRHAALLLQGSRSTNIRPFFRLTNDHVRPTTRIACIQGWPNVNLSPETRPPISGELLTRFKSGEDKIHERVSSQKVHRSQEKIERFLTTPSWETTTPSWETDCRLRFHFSASHKQHRSIIYFPRAAAASAMPVRTRPRSKASGIFPLHR